MKYYKSVDFLSNFKMSTPCTNVKSPNWRPYGDGSVGNEQKQGIALCTCNWRGPSQQLDQVRRSRWSGQASSSQPQPVLNLFRIFFKMDPCTYTGLRASADRVNIWSLLYILRGLNHHWNVKWTTKRSLHHSDHIIIFIIIACCMQCIYSFQLKTGILHEILT